MDTENKDKVLSSIVELLSNDPNFYIKYLSNEAINLIKDADQNGTVHIFEDHLIIKLSMEDWIKYQKTLTELEFLISKKFSTVQNLYTGASISIQLIPRNINAHKVNITESYIKDRITNITEYINTETFKKHAERLLKSLETDDYSAAVTNARAAVESFTKHLTGKMKIDNGADHNTLLQLVISQQLQISDTGSKSDINTIISAIIKNLDNNLLQLSKLRNDHGIDHGKHPEYKPCLEKHHANLAVGTAILFMDFISTAKNVNILS